MFLGTGSLSPFGLGLPAAAEDAVADAGILVDGRAAVAVPEIDGRRARLVSHSVDPESADLKVVQVVPLAFVDDGGPSEFTGVEIERTTVQDADGRQTTFTDVFRSVAGALHDIEARYGEGAQSSEFGGAGTSTEEPSFRLATLATAVHLDPPHGVLSSRGSPLPPARTSRWWTTRHRGVAPGRRAP